MVLPEQTRGTVRSGHEAGGQRHTGDRGKEGSVTRREAEEQGRDVLAQMKRGKSVTEVPAADMPVPKATRKARGGEQSRRLSQRGHPRKQRGTG